MNEATDQRPNPKWRWLRMLATLSACCAILGGAVVAIIVINQTEPTAQKDNSSRKSAALVETISVQRGTYSPRLVVLGTVQAAQDIVLSPRVSGQVVEMSDKLVPGGMVSEGDLLFRIDPADFENAVSIRQSELAQAEASREIEQARQRLAEKELKMLEGSIDGTNRSLVLREPQIASIEAEVSAAKAAVDLAILDLERSSVYAPFDAQVLSRSVNIGSQLRPGDEVARLIGLNEYWIMAAVPVRTLRWIQFPETGKMHPQSEAVATAGKGSKVILRNPEVWGSDAERHARVAKMIGTLDGQTRLARVLIVVDDPLGRNSGAPPLILDSLIETEIEGRPIVDVVRLKRDFVRDSDTVWVMVEDKLQIRQAEVVFRDIDYAYISAGLEDGDEVVVTTLATVAEGVSLKKISPAESQETTDNAKQTSDQQSADSTINRLLSDEPAAKDTTSSVETEAATQSDPPGEKLTQTAGEVQTASFDSLPQTPSENAPTEMPSPSEKSAVATPATEATPATVATPETDEEAADKNATEHSKEVSTQGEVE